MHSFYKVQTKWKKKWSTDNERYTGMKCFAPVGSFVAANRWRKETRKRGRACTSWYGSVAEISTMRITAAEIPNTEKVTKISIVQASEKREKIESNEKPAPARALVYFHVPGVHEILRFRSFQFLQSLQPLISLFLLHFIHHDLIEMIDWRITHTHWLRLDGREQNSFPPCFVQHLLNGYTLGHTCTEAV